MIIDTNFLLLVILPMILGIYAQQKVVRTYNRYSNERLSRNLTGCEAARRILDDNGLWNVKIERVSGMMSDHYDPRTNVIRLSDGVYNSTSIAAIGIAAHECGHAIQYAKDYTPIKIRSAILPITNIGSQMAVPLVLVGMLLSWSTFAYIGLFGYALIALFQIATLPVEFNASNRAMASISNMGLTKEEIAGARNMLSAAALTYVAAMVASLTQFVRMASIVKRNNRK